MIALHDNEDWFLLASVAVTILVFLSAHISSARTIGIVWWLGLTVFAVFSVMFFTILTFAGPGNGALCKSTYVYRFRQIIPVGPPQECLIHHPQG
ncbi:MAG: hypothetical protein KDD98_06305 [Sphingomonadaceae bacterium]|nr:hypothetical protein [Sphingomonadaceae bacterium]